jgi:AcrR family transcriptional regulator
MSSALSLAPASAPHRKRNAEATRAAILEAAKGHFALLGYDRAVLREIASEAGVDVALIKRYFGGKEGLFTEALNASFAAAGGLPWTQETFARDAAESLAGSPHADEEASRRFQFLLRAATSPTTAPLLNVVVMRRFLQVIREWLGGADADVRARVVAAAYIGLLVERLIRGEALQGRERAVFTRQVTDLFQRLLCEDQSRTRAET